MKNKVIVLLISDKIEFKAKMHQTGQGGIFHINNRQFPKKM